MKTLGMREIRASSTVLTKALSESGEVILTNHGKPFAKVIPYEPVTVDAPAAPLTLKWLRSQMRKSKRGSERIVREDRDARS